MSKQRPLQDTQSAATTAAPQTILMATDLSARSDRALERSVTLAKSHGAQLVVFHVLDEDLPASVQDRVASAATDEIEDCVSKIQGAEGVDVTIDVAAGKDYRDIIDKADAVSADLIVMGIHRNESGSKPLAGTTLERVIRKGKHPVLVVPARVKGPYERVLVGVDFSVFSRLAIRSASATAPGAEFHIVHAFQVPFEGFQPGREARRAVQQEHDQELTRMIEDEMASLIDVSGQNLSAERPPHKLVRHGDAGAVLRAEVERVKPDLLALGTHGRVGLSHALLGSVAEDFLNNPPCDVLVVKAW